MLQAPQLSDLAGEFILARIPALQQDGWVRAKLHSVEHAGIWIENQKLTDACLRKHKSSSAEMVYIFFVPFTDVLCILLAAEGVSISAESLGVAC